MGDDDRTRTTGKDDMEANDFGYRMGTLLNLVFVESVHHVARKEMPTHPCLDTASPASPPCKLDCMSHIWDSASSFVQKSNLAQSHLQGQCTSVLFCTD